MKLFVYILIYPLIWFVSILPFRLLYVISDIFYMIIYYVIGYRKKVVLENLKLAFPQSSDKELLRIRKKSFRHFVDVFIEMIKSFTISEKEMNRRYTYTNSDFLDELYQDGKSVILLASHYANWEWIVNLSLFVKYQCVGAYTKVNNPYFNKRILKSREKFGVKLVQTTKTIPLIINHHNNNIQSIYGLLSDQSPTLKKAYYWNNFFGVKVPIHTGAELLAKKYNMNVVMMETKKIKRGFYESTFSLLTSDAAKHPNYEITDIFLERTERLVRRKPAYYLWTHKRFKHRDKAPK